MKKMKILIGYDGSPCANQALRDLTKAGLPPQAEVVVLTVADVFLPPGQEIEMPNAIKSTIHRAHASARKKVQHASHLAKKARLKIKAVFPNWNVTTESAADSPAWALLKKAESWKADLILVGAHGHSKLGRYLGSISQMVLSQASCPVRVGRASSGQKARKPRVIVGVDGSPDSKTAVQAIANRFWPSGTKFQLISVLDPKKSTFMERLTSKDIRWFFQQADNERDVTGRMLELFAEKLREKKLDVTCQIKKGDPKHILVKEAESWNADCIFLGVRGLTHLKRFFTGGVSIAVAARAHCSVEVVAG